MTGALLYLFTAFIFFIVDMAGSGLIVRPVAEGVAGGALPGEVRALPAALFHIGYPAAIFWFVGAPAMRSGGSPGAAFLTGAGFGAAAYGTRELASLAALSAWEWRLALTGIAWGAFLTGLSAAAGLRLTRATGL